MVNRNPIDAKCAFATGFLGLLSVKLFVKRRDRLYYILAGRKLPETEKRVNTGIGYSQCISVRTHSMHTFYG